MITVSGKCAWSKAANLHQMQCIGEIGSTDAKMQIDRIKAAVQPLSTEEINDLFCQYIGLDVKILHRLLCTGLIQSIDIRRFLACKEIVASANFPYSQTIRYEIVGIKFGFNLNTVRRFFQRFPQYFECTSLFNVVQTTYEKQNHSNRPV